MPRETSSDPASTFGHSMTVGIFSSFERHERLVDLLLRPSVLRGHGMLADEQERLVGRNVAADTLAIEPVAVKRRAAVADHLRHQIDPGTADDVDGRRDPRRAG